MRTTNAKHPTKDSMVRRSTRLYLIHLSAQSVMLLECPFADFRDGKAIIRKRHGADYFPRFLGLRFA